MTALRAHPGLMSRLPRAVTGVAASARSRRSGASSGRGALSPRRRSKRSEAREIVSSRRISLRTAATATCGAGRTTKATMPGIIELVGGAARRPSTGSAFFTSTPRRSTTGSSRPSSALASPTSTLSLRRPRRRSCAGCGAGVTRDRFLLNDRTDPPPRAGSRARGLLHPRLSGRDRGGPRRAVEVHRGRAAGLGRLLHVSRARKDAGGHPREQVPAPARPRAPAGVLGIAGGDNGPPPPPLVGTTCEVLVDRAARRARSGRPRRSTASCACLALPEKAGWARCG